MLSFDALIAPLSVGDFCRVHWERAPYLRVDCRGAIDALTSADIEYLIASLPITTSDWIQVVKESRTLPTGAFVRDDGFVDLRRVYEAIDAGYTLQLAKLDKRWPVTQRLSRDAERALTSAGIVLMRNIGSHLYLTPTNAAGLPIHYDNHNVIVVQVSGSKHWRVYRPTELAPVARQQGPLPALGEMVLDTELMAGHVMYIPRGWPHQAVAAANGSVHVTLDVFAATWIDVVVEAMLTSPAARAGFVLDLDGDEHLSTRTTADLQAALASVSEAAVLTAARGLAGRFVQSLNPGLGSEFTERAERLRVNGDSLVRRREGAIAHLDVEADRVRLRFPGSALSTSKSGETLLRFIAEHAEFSLSDLPGALSPEQKQSIVQQLVQERFLDVFQRETA